MFGRGFGPLAPTPEFAMTKPELPIYSIVFHYQSLRQHDLLLFLSVIASVLAFRATGSRTLLKD